jgi:two-component system cell cycle response regulator DivK
LRREDRAAPDSVSSDQERAFLADIRSVNGNSILVVDDSSGSRVLFRTLLEKAGYEVRCAEDATSALKILADFQPDLILMDLLMPGIGGIALTRQLKSIPAMEDTVIIAITACSLASDAEKASAGGCDAVIVKPINPRTFVERVRSYLAPLKPATGQ